MTQWAKLPSVDACRLKSQLLLLWLQLPANISGKAADGNPGTWVLVVSVGNLDGASSPALAFVDI